MKYGLLMYNYGGKCNKDANDEYYINIGDNMQTLAIENLYKQMGIDDSQIKKIYYDEITTYEGEYVILPMNMFGSKNNIIPTSPYIVPLFIGFNYVTSKCREHKEYLKKHEPIGCRDEYTLNIMREQNIESYLSGCMTISLPKREKLPTQRKIFMVDTPKSLEKYIPSDLKSFTEYITHEIEIDNPLLDNKKVEIIDTYARRIMERYRDEATLVVTSRLHCAAPCIAMGIPVIIVKENIDINLSWIDRYIKVYSEEEFAQINWEPKVIDLENIKEKIIKVFKKQIETIIESKKYMYELSEIYEFRQKSKYNNFLAQKLDKNMKKLNKHNLRYVIWGTGSGGTLAHQLIKERYPNFEMVMAVDTYEKGYFFNTEIKHPSELNNHDYDYVFICTYSGRREAIKKMKELKLEVNEFYMFLISRVINKNKKVKKDFLISIENEG